LENLTFDGDGPSPSFVQKRLTGIDWGAFAEVHEVSFQQSILAMELLIVSMKMLVLKRCLLHLEIEGKHRFSPGKCFVVCLVIRALVTKSRRVSRMKFVRYRNSVGRRRTLILSPFFVKGKSKNSALYYIDMELCNGNLDQFIRDRGASSSTPITIADIWDIMVQITSGLAHIHSQGEVHRDIKPRNSKRCVE